MKKYKILLTLVGVTGSGKSTIAKALAKTLGWKIIEKDAIRIKLREEGHGFTPEKTDRIFYALINNAVSSGKNVILNSDFAEKNKKGALEKLARKNGARVFYLRLVCDRDIMLERIINAKYGNKTMFKSTAIALREHCRRYPWHYKWSKTHGGSYTLRKLPIKFLAEIDTTIPAKWKKSVRAVAKRLRRL
ncbi:MAG: AAA family ATPase [Patescibacteria group bacterium]